MLKRYFVVALLIFVSLGCQKDYPRRPPLKPKPNGDKLIYDANKTKGWDYDRYTDNNITIDDYLNDKYGGK